MHNFNFIDEILVPVFFFFETMGRFPTYKINKILILCLFHKIKYPNYFSFYYENFSKTLQI